MRQTTETFVHLTPRDYDVIGPERFGVDGLFAVESIGPGMPVKRLGPLFIVHDSTFDARVAIGHHPHQGMERLFYILSGAIGHDDTKNGITGHMGTGDLGILTEGRGGMVHSEANVTDGPARCYILVYPCEPLVDSASFDAIRGEEMAVTEGSGWRSTHVVQPGDTRLHGDIRLLADTVLEPGADFGFALNPEETALLFVVEGEAALRDGERDAATLGETDTLLWPPARESRKVVVRGRSRSRVLHLVMGHGDGLVTD